MCLRYCQLFRLLLPSSLPPSISPSPLLFLYSLLYKCSCGTDLQPQNLYEDCIDSEEGTCYKPPTYLSMEALLTLWRIIYWTMYIMCWTTYPILQEYSTCGGFSVIEKLYIALKTNLLFYGIAGTVMVVVLVLVAFSSQSLDGPKLLGVAIATANMWGLLLVILLMGYGIVEIPRKIWQMARWKQQLEAYQFHAVTLRDDLYESEEKLEKTLKLVRKVAEQTPEGDPWYPYVAQIVAKCQPEYQDIYYGEGELELTHKNLVHLHQKVKRVKHIYARNKSLYTELLNAAFELEDIMDTKQNPPPEYAIRWSFRPVNNSGLNKISNFFVWLWKVWLEPRVLQFLAFVCLLLSVTLLWSEVTFFSRSDPEWNPKTNKFEGGGTGPDLSIWSQLIHAPGLSDFGKQLFTFIAVFYLSACVYWSLFRFRFFDIYRLIPHQKSDAPSLMFTALYLGRLTAPLAYNFLHMIHHTDAAFSRLMGDMAVVPFIGGSFNTYVPIALIFIVLFTLFNLFSRIANLLHVARFQFADSSNQEQIDEGGEILRQERAKRERMLNSMGVAGTAPVRRPTFAGRKQRAGKSEDPDQRRKRREELKAKYTTKDENEGKGALSRLGLPRMPQILNSRPTTSPFPSLPDDIDVGRSSTSTPSQPPKSRFGRLTPSNWTRRGPGSGYQRPPQDERYGSVGDELL
ncbi:LMBR1 domain-containing protein 2, variant 4 [Balamuthia mandrillaris]